MHRRKQKEKSGGETKTARQKRRRSQSGTPANPQAVFRRFVRMLEQLQAGKPDAEPGSR